MVRRSDIPRASCKRIVQSGAHGSASRMGEDATEAAHLQLDLLIQKLGSEAAKQCKLMKRETVNLAVLKSVVEAHASCKGVKDDDYVHANRAGKGQRGLPKAGLVRHFKLSAGDKRITEEAANALVGVSEAFLRNLGSKASGIALAAKRQTMQAADIKLAASM